MRIIRIQPCTKVAVLPQLAVLVDVGPPFPPLGKAAKW